MTRVDIDRARASIRKWQPDAPILAALDELEAARRVVEAAQDTDGFMQHQVIPRFDKAGAWSLLKQSNALRSTLRAALAAYDESTGGES